MNMLATFVQVISGVGFGYVTGAGFSDLSLGRVGDCVAGLAGGWMIGKLIRDFCAAGVGLSDLQIFLMSVAGGGLGGAMMVLAAGFIRAAMHRK